MRSTVRSATARSSKASSARPSREAFASKDIGFTVGAILGFMEQQMPPGLPGGLTHKEYADVMAFILMANGYKPGSQPLTYDGAQNSKAPLIARE